MTLNFGGNEDAARLAERVRPSVVWIASGDGHGSGVVWDESGWIVTNDHVVSRDIARVETEDGRNMTARVLARDRQNDLAILSVNARLTAAIIGDSDKLRVGEFLMAVGNPRGVRGTVSLGIVSAAGNQTWMGRARRELVQADLTLAPGSSGGPLVNARGEVVGIASMILSPGIALAVPSRVAREFVETVTRAARRRAA